jgi:PPOX class probable F420-dependent enzyme
MPTPVNIAFDGDRAFFRSYDRACKAKRLRNSPSVEVAPSTFRGRVTGPTIAARAMLLADGEADIAAKALARQHRILQGLLVHTPPDALPDDALRVDRT